jgi:agmatinase
MTLEMNPNGPLPGDNAFRRETLKGTQWEPTYAGTLSFMRRKYTRDLTGVDIAVTGIPFDQATSHRPGAARKTSPSGWKIMQPVSWRPAPR